MDEESRAYFARRAAEEQAQAERATNPIVADVHRKLQRAYAERASVGDRDRQPASID